jgi:hypothetical protein
MLIYIDRLIETQGLVITKLNVHRLLIANMMLAAKYHDDLFYNNAYYAKLGGLSLLELNLLELDILQFLNYSMFVSDQMYQKYYHQLQNYKFMIPPKNGSFSPNTVAMVSTPPMPLSETFFRTSPPTVVCPAMVPAIPAPSIPWPEMSCVNAFQFSPHFLAPQQCRSASISPCGTSSVASSQSSSTNSYRYNTNNMNGCSTAFSFSRSGSLDSFNITPTKMSHSSCSLFEDSQDRWGIPSNDSLKKPVPMITHGNGFYSYGPTYPNQQTQAPHYQQPSYPVMNMNVSSYPPSNQFPLVSFPSFIPVPANAAPSQPYLIPVPPQAPAVTAPLFTPPYYPTQSKSGKACLKKRTHNDIYEDNMNFSKPTYAFPKQSYATSASIEYCHSMNYTKQTTNFQNHQLNQHQQQFFGAWKNQNNLRHYNDIPEHVPVRLVALN